MRHEPRTRPSKEKLKKFWVLSLCLPKVLSMIGDFAGYLPTLLAEAQLRACHTYLPPWLSYELVVFWFAGTTSCTSSPGWPRRERCLTASGPGHANYAVVQDRKASPPRPRPPLVGPHPCLLPRCSQRCPHGSRSSPHPPDRQPARGRRAEPALPAARAPAPAPGQKPHFQENAPRSPQEPILAPVEGSAWGGRPYLPTRPASAQAGLAHTYLPPHLAYGQSH